MVVIAFVVGLSISVQTFYTFILENLEKFGALKAIGAKGRELVYMILRHPQGVVHLIAKDPALA
jgi:putative ABC transport system permease protein